MENKIPESGEPITVEECRRCGAMPARGTEFIRGGIKIFRCEECNKSMNNGYREEVHKKQLEGRLAHEKATENRDRFRREHQESQELEFERRKQAGDPTAYDAYSLNPFVKQWKF